jgi:hypothetical protein
MSKSDKERISRAILKLVPLDGSSIGNIKLLGILRGTWPALEHENWRHPPPSNGHSESQAPKFLKQSGDCGKC